MGLNFKRRPIREQLGINDDLIARSLADTDYRFAHMDEHVVLNFEHGIYNRIDDRRRQLFKREGAGRI